LFALHVIAEEENETEQAKGKKMLEKAMGIAAATDNIIIPLARHDYNISNGIVYTIKEQSITDVVLGLHHNAEDGKDFFGPIAEKIIRRTLETVFVYKSLQPFNTLKRMVVVVPSNAELEPGFVHWFDKLSSVAKESGFPVFIYASPDTIKHLQQVNGDRPNPLDIKYNEFTNWDDFLIFSKEVKANDLFIIISSRQGHVSYQSQLDRLPHNLTKYFKENSFIILYPKQLEHNLQMQDASFANTTTITTLTENRNFLNKLKNLLKKGNEK